MNQLTNNENKPADFFLDLNINVVEHTYKTKTGTTKGYAIQLKKDFGLNETNFDFLKKLIELSLKDKFIVITTPVRIKFFDKIKAISKLQQAGLKIEKKE